ncbi:MgtC/SapB family protein [Halomonas ramblicola]|uniref:MgtC/SapB family protein n=1 Tax=Halomonas ramblicola TaxID=747349 RepID=UPI0025B60A88|nr:MgtC/SapB family protein [Halomonas ramblicola]MDN3523540.1 MgtC/SapB family protein [Halomonas ramblicola]
MEEVTRQFLDANQPLIRLAVALLLGALIGIERGWVARQQRPGERIAGVRTHALVGLLGGIAALLSASVSDWAFPLIFVAVAATALVAWRARLGDPPDYSITGLIGLLLTFCFGAVAVGVDLAVATACTVATAVILDNKREIHGLLNRLQARELDAGLKLLVISVVMLPLLPDRAMGPGNVLNPYELWWMVVLIAVVSFVGYFAVRVGGPEKGILFTSLFAGLSSSTALTLHFARQSRLAPSLSPLLAAGILLACGTMFPRILLYTAVVNPGLLPSLLLPVSLMALTLYLPALWIWRRHRRNGLVENAGLVQNPLELRTALFFGALLALIMLLGEWLRGLFGEAGIYLLAISSGMADVGAITLSLTRMSLNAIEAQTAVLGIILAAATNNLVKAGLAGALGTRHTGWRVALPMLASLVVGLAAVAQAMLLAG